MHIHIKSNYREPYFAITHALEDLWFKRFQIHVNALWPVSHNATKSTLCGILIKSTTS